MIKTMAAGLALMAAALPAAVMAQEGAKLDCVLQDTADDLKESLFTAMMASDTEAREPLFAQLRVFTTSCAERHGIAEDHRRSYFNYSLSRMMRDRLIEALAGLGISALPVDRALDFGPDGSNPALEGGITDEQLESIEQAYQADGVDFDNLDEAGLERIGMYAAITSIYWTSRADLPF
ncbi:MAG TPA: hypothetical protein PKD99_09390 [Sphingopyxis sp.]|nr:hypothetical protein [Sphingopyxis sp.]HMP45305.1 hypothetical protein [Sphingopyxis sp.]HMQ19561.1 hypothetical protein [Sphingopyxis sp.]